MKRSKNEDVEAFGRLVIITFLACCIAFLIALIIVALTPEKPPTPVGDRLNILPDEIAKYGPQGYVPQNTPEESVRVYVKPNRHREETEWDDLRDIIENYSEDPYDVENALEELRREVEETKELIKKYEKRRAREDETKDFWTLDNREL